MLAEKTRDDLFASIELTAGEARRAFPLVHLFHPSLSVEQWLKFAQGSTRAPSGVVAIEDTRGCIHATFVYTVDSRINRGPVLRISELMVGRLPGSLVNNAIIGTIERLARAKEAEAIEIILPSALEYAVDPVWRGALTAAGFSTRTTSMVRPLAAQASAMAV